MTNPVTPSQFYWTRQAIEAMSDLMPQAVIPRETVASEIESRLARAGRSFVKRADVESYFGYCNAESL